MRYTVIAVLLSFWLVSTAAAQAVSSGEHGGDPVPVARAAAVEGSIEVDGRLDDAAWASASEITEFTQLDPDEGEPVSQPTRVRIVYGDAALYVGARLEDSGRTIGRLGRRDMDRGDSDWFAVAIDSYHDHRTAFVFEVNPAGVRRDMARTTASGGSGGSSDDDASWDAVWRAAASRDGDGWTAELRIPFSQLRFSDAERPTWGIQLVRVIGRSRETALFSFTPKRERGGVARYGHLVGLEGIRPGTRLELLPYTVARGEYVDPGANPYRSDAEHGLAAGLDVLYRVTSDLTLNATFNPDFGQVEVDPAVVNLGVYETFFREKRPFFVEGSEIFDFDTGGGGQLFYSRRIGRRPQLSPPARAADVPDATTILGAAKLSGKTAGGWSIGVLDAVTRAETARYLDPETGEDARMTIEPATNYFVGRARREARGGRSAVGGILTAVHRGLSTGALRAALPAEAYAGGLDVRHEWADRSWVVEGGIAGSLVRGDPAVLRAIQRASNHYFQRPDAEHLDVDSAATSLGGVSARLSLAKQAGEHWRGRVRVGMITPGFEVNDLGFGYRTDRRDIDGSLRYVENQPGEVLRDWEVAGFARFEANTDNRLIANWMNLSVLARHLDYWGVRAALGHSLRTNDDRTTRGGPIMVRPAENRLAMGVFSDPRRSVTVRGDVFGVRDEFGGWRLDLRPRLVFKPSSRWEVTVGPRLLRDYTVAQYVATVPDPAATATYGRRYVFAPLDRTEVGLETRVDLSFSPGLSLQAYVQPLISTGDYGAPKALEAPATYAFRPYDGDVPDRDFNLRSLRGNAVLRWEWRPGSTLYLAWQQSRRDLAPGVGGFDLARDPGRLLAAAPDDIVVLKVDYWLSL